MNMQLAAAIAGFAQGLLLAQVPILSRWLRNLMLKRRQLGPGTCREAEPSRVVRISFFFIALLTATLPTIVLSNLKLPGEQGLSELFLVYFLGVLFGVLPAGVWNIWRSVPADPIEGLVGELNMPIAAVFGRFRNEDDELREFMRALGEKAVRRLWNKIERVPVDLDDDGWLLEKYSVDPAQGLQVMVFLKNGEKVDFDGRDRLYLEDVRSPERLQQHFQLVMDRWNTSDF